MPLFYFFKNNFSCLILTILLLALPAAAQQWTWRDFSPANSGWRVLAPGALQPDDEARKRNSSKGSYIYNDSQGFFAVIYQQYSKWDWFTQSSRFNKQRDMVIKANNGQLVKDVEITNRGMVGREVEVKFAAGSLTQIEGPSVTKYRVQRFRMFFQGKKFFIILAVLPENVINKPEIDNFLNSFNVNSEPKASDNDYTVDEDTTLTINAANGILANDSDPDKDRLSVSAARAISDTANGTLSINADGSFTYKPKPNFSGTDTFTYKASDGVADSEVARVTIRVNPINDAPAISNVPASLTVDELLPVRFSAVGSDVDNPVGSLKFSLTGAPDGAEINSQSGAFSWTPSEAQGQGSYNFKVNVSDGKETVSAPISLTINEVNVAPSISAAPSGGINELEPYSFSVRALDTDLPAQTLTYALQGAPEGVSIDPRSGLIRWNPTELQGNGGDYKFTLSVTDGQLTVDSPVSLTVREVNSAPVLDNVPDSATNELEPFRIRLRASDNDLPANNLTYSLAANTPAGMTIDPQTGEISWNPTEEQGPGEVTVTVRATDNGTPQLSDTKTIKVRVNEVNSAPRLAPIGDQTVKEETALSFTASATDADLPKNNLRYSLINGPDGAVIDAGTGRVSWIPTETQGPGTYKMTVRVTDNGTPELFDEASVNITVEEVNKPPVANTAAAATDEDSPAAIILTASDTDLPANTLTYSIVSNPAHGTLSGSGPNLTFTPNKDFNGSDSFTFKVNDGASDSNTVQVRIEVKPVNDQPAAGADAATTNQDTAIVVKVLDNDQDIDGDRLVVTGVRNVTGGRAEIADGAVRFTPEKDFVGTAGFEYEISDNKGGTAVGTVRITVVAVKPN